MELGGTPTEQGYQELWRRFQREPHYVTAERFMVMYGFDLVEPIDETDTFYALERP